MSCASSIVGNCAQSDGDGAVGLSLDNEDGEEHEGEVEDME